MRLYGCGYNGSAESPGIWLFDVESGLVGECSGAENPSYCALAATPEGKRAVYAACELTDRAELALYGVGEDGVPVYRDKVDFEGASGTCFVLVDPDGRCAYGADYNSGSVCCCKLDPDGAFAQAQPLVQHVGHGPARAEGDPNFDRQLSAHVHTLSFVPKTPLIAAVDLGMDEIAIYRPQPDGTISPSDMVSVVRVPEGCGPRIVAYHPTLLVAAVVCELSCEVLVYSIDSNGLRWDLMERHGLIDGKAVDWTASGAGEGIPQDEYPPLAAHAEYSADGRFLYVSTRGTNTITLFAVDAAGHAKQISVMPCGGRSPRHFAISPRQDYLAIANQVSDCITVFSRDAETGLLQEFARLECRQPSCVAWV